MSHQKNELHELLQYLTPQERAELEALATPSDNASGCLVLHNKGGDYDTESQAAMNDYIGANGYAPPMTIHVNFVAPGDI